MPSRARLSRALPFALIAAAAALPALAQYKSVGPDGRVTYSDRPVPGAPSTRVSASGSAGAADANLPYELRQVASRFPVTLYSAANCGPCDQGRRFLRERGVPFAERTAATPEDGQALQRLAGTREVPVLTIGSQVMRGFAAESWTAYLDAAGYPRESKLPANYRAPAPVPLVAPAPAPAPAAEAAPPPAAEPQAPAPGAGGIRF